ncbi:uncharacterized protein [Ptychodera flava]|uniref:uncharacterized protein n=1 Tax=Ptychodera flava TaxID=63121 RepID=UPI00396A706D
MSGHAAEDNTSGNASCSMTETIETLSSQSGYEGVRIVEGNKNDRFKVNAITGDISVNGYLDYDIDSEYTLKIALTSAPKTMQSTYSIEIVVDDVIDWPPYYNETCEMPTRGQQDGWTLPFTFLVGTLKVPLGRILRRPVDEFVEGDMNNGKCKLTAFSKARTKTQHHDITDVNLQKCSSNGIDEDFPPDAIINKKWFDYNNTGMIRYSLVQVTSENINTTLSPLQLHCDVEIEGKLVFSETAWLDYIGCPTGKYGFKCHKPCICKNGAKCSVFNGACKCTSGWIGPACDIPKASIMVVPQRSEAQYGTFAGLTCSSQNIDLPKKQYEWDKA